MNHWGGNNGMKYIPLLSIFLFACSSDYDMVEKSYFRGNPHAKFLLENGFTDRSSNRISSKLIKSALQGDEDAKIIVIAQSNVFNRESESMVRSHPVFIPMKH